MKRRGMSLMEVVLAVGLAALTLLLLIGVITGGTRLMARSSSIATSTEVARQFLEVARRNGHGKLPESPRVFDGRTPDAAVGDFPPAPYPQAEVGGRRYPLRISVDRATGSNRALTVEVFDGDNARVILYTVVHP